MDRTLRATLLAALIGFVTIAGLGVLLTEAVTGSLIAGAIAGLLAGLLLWGASRRAASFHPDDDPPDQPPAG